MLKSLEAMLSMQGSRAEKGLWAEKTLNVFLFSATVIAILIASATSILLNSTIYQDQRFAFVFDSDGPRETLRVQDSLQTGSPYPQNNFIYGNVPYFIAYLLLFPWKLGGFEISFQSAAFSLLIPQLLAYFFTVFLSARIALLLEANLTVALSLALAVAVMPVVLRWTLYVHPDLFMLAFTLMSLVILLRFGEKGLWWSGVTWGLAVGTKYLAAIYFVVPLVLFTGLWLRGQSRGPLVLRQLIVFGGSGVLAFSVTNLTFMLNLNDALKQLTDVSKIMANGDGYSADPNPFLWIDVFWADFRPFALVVPLSIVIVLAFWLLYGRPRLGQVKSLIGIAGFAILFFGLFHLGLEVNHRVGRYALHLVPAALLFLSVIAAANWPGARALSRRGLAALIVIPLLVGVSQRVPVTWNYVERLLVSVNQNQIVAAGKILEQSCPSHTKVLAPMYSYAPPKFSNLVGERTYLISPEMLEEADVLFFNHSVPGRFIWPASNGTDFSYGAFHGSNEQAGLLLDSVFRESEFDLVFSADEAMIFQKKEFTGCNWG